MTEEQNTLFDVPSSTTVDRRDDAQFQHDIKRLVEKAEAIRVDYMNKHQSAKMMAASVGLTILMAGAMGFGWFLLMQPDLLKAFASLFLGLVIPFLLRGWVKKPLQNYIRDYKRDYLPELADLMGGFSYHPERGISEKIIRKTGVTPKFSRYTCEDCFRGVYKGNKVLFSEAKLFDEKKRSVFNGLFVLVEVPHKVFDGHTIVTADRDMAEANAGTKWRKLQKVPLTIENKLWDRFVAYSDQAQAASLILGQNLIKELAEVDIAFGDAEMSAVLFRGKYIFLMIPHEDDMFEASDLYVPISTHKHAMACKREIEQLLEMIDVFNLYGSQQ